MTRIDARRARRQWLRPFVTRGRAVGDIPFYGTNEWLDLATDDPRRVAGICLAAEAYALSTDPDEIARRVEDELQALRDRDADRCDREWPAAAARVVRLATSPSWDELRSAS